ncbi:MAG: ABC transporter permease, partial [Prevotellaceae bacterium]|nr:ABC transporter permease [Prevotellaceae bacterium]
MIHHYLKIAFRNLWKYKNQTFISVVGLAVGFTCFAMATLWIRYEMTFDGFHKNADRIYRVKMLDYFDSDGSIRGPYLLAAYLKATFPEIAHAAPLQIYRYSAADTKIEYEGVTYPADVLDIDSSFFGMFEVKIVEGDMDFLIPESKKIAITREKARQLFGNENPIGKTIKMRDDYAIGAVVTGFPKQSNYPFDFLHGLTNGYGVHTLIELLPGIDVETFGKKLYEHTVNHNKVNSGLDIVKMTVSPLTTPHKMRKDVKFQHIVIFSVAGSLLILCTLFNYLTLFVSRFRIRLRELALRMVCGASNSSLFALLSVEFIISLIIALLLGLLFVQTAIPHFRQLSGIRLELSSIYLEALIYIAGIILFSLLAFLVVLTVFRRKTLNAAIRKSNKKLSRKISIVVQLIISICFAFCTTIIVKQMYYLHNTADLGFAVKNRGSLTMMGDKIDVKMLDDKIRQIPGITETVAGISPLMVTGSGMRYRCDEWDDKPKDAELVIFDFASVSERFLEYYEIQLIEGEMLNDTDDKTTVLINESAAKALGWRTSAGKSFGKDDLYFKIKGVIKNIYAKAPTVIPDPFIYTHVRHESEPDHSILFKYAEGTWKTCRERIEKIVKEEYPNFWFRIHNAEEFYEGYLKSENTLLTLLTLISLVCVFICVFGFVSMVSLTCEERRKEIA